MKAIWTLGTDVEVEVSHYYPGRPARLSGPPEDCYEAEAEEVDISAVYVYGVDVSGLLTEEAWAQITEEVIAQIKARRAADAEDAWEAREDVA